MRRDFAKLLLTEMEENEKIVVLTADLGYGLLDNIRNTFPTRFFNIGSSEQLMIGSAAGMALEGKIPICYSITPFLIFRPFEFIRNLMNHDGIPVKLVGGGRNRDYGYLGFSHWAEDDIDHMSVFKNIKLYKPTNVNCLVDCYKEFLYNGNPSYLNLIK